MRRGAHCSSTPSPFDVVIVWVNRCFGNRCVHVFQNPNCKVTTLYIRRNTIGPDGAKRLSEALQVCRI